MNTLEQVLQPTYKPLPKDGNIKLTRDTLKKNLIEYNQNPDSKPFDEKFIIDLENKYNIRFVGVHLDLDKKILRHNRMNVYAYSSNGQTITMQVEGIVKSKTITKFSEVLFDYINNRMKLNPETLGDKLTIDAIKSIDKKVEMSTNRSYDFMKQYYPAKKN